MSGVRSHGKGARPASLAANRQVPKDFDLEKAAILSKQDRSAFDAFIRCGRRSRRATA